MEGEWKPIYFDIMPYKETGTYILKASEDISQQLDDHIVMTQSMSFSPYKKPFEERISTWENKLKTTQVNLQNPQTHCLVLKLTGMPLSENISMLYSSMMQMSPCF